MARFKNADWDLPKDPNGNISSWSAVQVAVLMDIRDQLLALNNLLGCKNFTRIPTVLDSIATNTTKRKRKAGAK